jgi:hypothetical protein
MKEIKILTKLLARAFHDWRDCGQRLRRFEDAYQIMTLVDRLREKEGAAVTIVCDNPDFNGQPDRAISVCDDWTNWEERTFRGKFLITCLQDALAAREASPIYRAIYDRDCDAGFKDA